jgi:transposase
MMACPLERRCGSPGVVDVSRPWLVEDDLWDLVEPLVPVPPPRGRNSGRKRFPDRLCLQGILFVLTTGIGWEHLPRELGFGSGMTCWRRLRDWNDAGAWQRVREVLLAELHAADRIDWSRAVVAPSHVRAARRVRAPVRSRLPAAAPAPSAT